MFIDEQRGHFGVEPICRSLGVSASAGATCNDALIYGHIGQFEIEGFYMH